MPYISQKSPDRKKNRKSISNMTCAGHQIRNQVESCGGNLNENIIVV